MKLIGGLITLLFMSHSGWAALNPAEDPNLSQVERFDLKLCGKNPKNCFSVKGDRAETHSPTELLFVSKPEVKGLGFDKRVFSSAIIDLTGGQIYLREVSKGTYIGEWTIDLDYLKSQFFPVTK